MMLSRFMMICARMTEGINVFFYMSENLLHERTREREQEINIVLVL